MFCKGKYYEEWRWVEGREVNDGDKDMYQSP
jgi:hypothetical protein